MTNLLTAAIKIFPDFEMWPTKPRFHVLEPRLFRVSAILNKVYIHMYFALYK